MKLVQLKCKSCGSPLKVKENSKKVKCDFCGITTILDDEKIVVEHKIRNTEIDIMYDNANIYLNKLKKYDEAKEIFINLSKINPGDPKVWEGIIRSETENFTNFSVDEEGYEAIDMNLIESAFENYSALNENEEDDMTNKYNIYLDKLWKELSKQRAEEKEKYNSSDELEEFNFGNRFIVAASLIALVFLFIYFFLDVDDSYSEIKNKTKLTTEELLEEYYEHVANIDCSYFEDGIMDIEMNENIFITKDKVYEITRSGLFSNDEQCREIGTLGQKIEEVGELKQFDYYVSSRNLYVTTEKGYLCSLPELSCSKDHYSSLLISGIEPKFEQDSYKFAFRTHENGLSGGKALVYNESQKKLYYASEIWLVSTQGYFPLQEIELHFEDDEYIIHIGKNVTTNKAFYYVKEYISNYEDCNKYVDVACESKYGIFKLNRLSRLYDEILFAGRYIVTKDGKIYEGTSYR